MTFLAVSTKKPATNADGEGEPAHSGLLPRDCKGIVTCLEGWSPLMHGTSILAPGIASLP